MTNRQIDLMTGRASESPSAPSSKVESAVIAKAALLCSYAKHVRFDLRESDLDRDGRYYISLYRKTLYELDALCRIGSAQARRAEDVK